MWIVGGETFSHSKYMVATLTPDLNNEDVQGIWRLVHAQGEKGPSPRYGHSAVMHDDKVRGSIIPYKLSCLLVWSLAFNRSISESSLTEPPFQAIDCFLGLNLAHCRLVSHKNFAPYSCQMIEKH